jgi:hypothetical protein
MIDVIRHINAGDKEYPIAFTLNVMEAIQEKYGSMDEWGKVLQPEDGEPSIKDLKWTFQQFINEGIEIQNEEKGEERPLLSEKQVGRVISFIGVNNIGNLIKDLTVKSVETDDSKNA